MFDAESKSAVKNSNRMVRKTGNRGAEMYFSVNKPDIFKKWSDKIKVQCVLPPFYNIQKNKKWKFSTQFFMTVCNVTKIMKYIVLEFK